MNFRQMVWQPGSQGFSLAMASFGQPQIGVTAGPIWQIHIALTVPNQI
jgi:hypothetical protein